MATIDRARADRITNGARVIELPRTPEPEVMDSAEEAESYDAMDHHEVNQLFVDDLVQFPGLQPTDIVNTIIDLGTGTAQIPLMLSQKLTTTATILCCDLSLEMLNLARRNIGTAGCQQSLVPLLASARGLPVADRSCRLVISNSIIHHIPEPLDVFREVRRIAAADAGIFFRDLLRPQTANEVERLVQQWAGTATDHQQRMFRESLHSALTVWEVGQLLEQAGLNPAWVQQTSDRHWTIAGRMGC